MIYGGVDGDGYHGCAAVTGRPCRKYPQIRPKYRKTYAKIWSILSENFVPAASGAARPEPAALGSAAAPAASTASQAAHTYHELIHGFIHELIRTNRMNS